jgi:hypothetical protein
MHFYIRIEVRMITTSAAKKIEQKIIEYGQDWYSVQARKAFVEILFSEINKAAIDKKKADTLRYLALKLANFTDR